jgi:hypothetical protein
MRDRTRLTPLHQTATTLHRQRGVERRTGLSALRDESVVLLILPLEDPPLPQPLSAVTNLTTRNI